MSNSVLFLPYVNGLMFENIFRGTLISQRNNSIASFSVWLCSNIPVITKWLNGLLYRESYPKATSDLFSGVTLLIPCDTLHKLARLFSIILSASRRT